MWSKWQSSSEITQIKRCSSLSKKILKITIFINYKFYQNIYELQRKIRWYNENSAKLGKDFTFRFQGKKILLYLWNFPRLILIFYSNITDKNVLKFQHEFIQLIQGKMDMTLSSISKSLPNILQCLEKTHVNNVS